MTLLNVHRPRDRSHCERFTAWHESVYRGVEATRVTPFSPRAMDRGLAAVTVAMARLGIPELTPLPADGRVEQHAGETESLLEALAGRAGTHAEGLADDTVEQVRARVQSLLDDWAQIAHAAREGGGCASATGVAAGSRSRFCARCSTRTGGRWRSVSRASVLRARCGMWSRACRSVSAPGREADRGGNEVAGSAASEPTGHIMA